MTSYRVTMDLVDVEADSPEAAVRVAVAGPAPPTFRVIELKIRTSLDHGLESVVNTIILAER